MNVKFTIYAKLESEDEIRPLMEEFSDVLLENGLATEEDNEDAPIISLVSAGFFTLSSYDEIEQWLVEEVFPSSNIIVVPMKKKEE